MKQIKTIFGLLIVMIFFMTGCTKVNNNKEGANTKGDKLVVYSPHKQSLIDLGVELYKAETGKEVKIITGGTGELIARLKSEKENPQADMIWGGSMNTLLPEQELFESYVSPNEQELFDDFKNVEGNITRFSAIPSVIVVNKEVLSELTGLADASEMIKGYQSIIDMAQKYPSIIGNIGNADPSKSSSSYEQLINQIWAFTYKSLGGETTDVTQADLDKGWEGVAKLIKTYKGRHSAGSSAVIADIANGETAIALSYEMAGAEAVDKSKGALALVYPEEGSIVKPDAMAIIKGAKNLEEAKAFTDFLLSKKMQDSVKKIYRRAVRKDADMSGSPLLPMTEFKVISDISKMNDKQAFLEKYENIFDE